MGAGSLNFPGEDEHFAAKGCSIERNSAGISEMNNSTVHWEVWLLLPKFRMVEDSFSFESNVQGLRIYPVED